MIYELTNPFLRANSFNCSISIDLIIALYPSFCYPCFSVSRGIVPTLTNTHYSILQYDSQQLQLFGWIIPAFSDMTYYVCISHALDVPLY